MLDDSPPSPGRRTRTAVASGPRRLTVLPTSLRLAGRVLLVDGDPAPFDVTLGPGEAVTLDLGGLREQGRR